MRPKRSTSQEALRLSWISAPRAPWPAENADCRPYPASTCPWSSGKTCEPAMPALARASSTRQAASRTS